MPDQSKLSPPQVIIVAAGAVLLIASFLPWIDVFDITANAWDDGLFPTYAWPGLLGAAAAAQVLIATFSTVSMNSRIAGFTWPQVHLVLAAVALLQAVSFLIAGDEHGFGFWLSLLASIGLLVGAVMLERQSGSAAA